VDWLSAAAAAAAVVGWARVDVLIVQVKAGYRIEYSLVPDNLCQSHRLAHGSGSRAAARGPRSP
jgi:hypothetical protein